MPSVTFKMQENLSAAGPHWGAYSTPSIPLAGLKGAGCPLPKNSTPVLSLSGLRLRALLLTCSPFFAICTLHLFYYSKYLVVDELKVGHWLWSLLCIHRRRFCSRP